MVIIKEKSKNKLGNRERRRGREVFKEVSTPKIIVFELGRKAVEKGRLRGRAKSCEADGAHSFARRVAGPMV